MSDFDHNEWRQNLAATENLQSIKKWQLKKYLQYFIKVQPHLTTQSQENRDARKERIELLRRELDQRRVIKPAWIGAIAGTVAAVVTIILSVQEMFPFVVQHIGGATNAIGNTSVIDDRNTLEVKSRA